LTEKERIKVQRLLADAYTIGNIRGAMRGREQLNVLTEKQKDAISSYSVCGNFTDAGRYLGISRNACINRFNGRMKKLKKAINEGSPFKEDVDLVTFRSSKKAVLSSNSLDLEKSDSYTSPIIIEGDLDDVTEAIKEEECCAGDISGTDLKNITEGGLFIGDHSLDDYLDTENYEKMVLDGKTTRAQNRKY